MSENMKLKDGLSEKAVQRIAAGMSAAYSEFDSDSFMKEAMEGLIHLELKERVHHIIHSLHRHLPNDYKTTANILVQVVKSWDHGDESDPLRGFAAWPLIDYIGVYGLDDPELSLQVLKTLTSLFSAEFAIRPFLVKYRDDSIRQISQWCNDEDHHVRRLVSEGTRPRLPWGIRLHDFVKDPSLIMPLLEELRDDPSEYVRRSVANSLNDISKDHPEIVIDVCKRWQKNQTPERKRIIKHATRTLVKMGHPAIFGLLGYTDSPKIMVREFHCDKSQIKIGESLYFTTDLISASKKRQSVVLDYIIHHVKKNGKTSSKVFKWKNIEFQPNETVTVKKKHGFQIITTRKYYSGLHRIELLINGVSYGEITFELFV